MNNGTIIAAVFRTQYYLAVNSSYGNPTGDGWYDTGSSGTFGVTNPYLVGDDTRCIFIAWNGTGSGSYSGLSDTYTLTMNNPVTETAVWQVQYKVAFSTNPYFSGTTVPSGTETWQNTGNLSLSSNPNTNYVFTSWSTSGLITIDNPYSANAIATINGPGTITANYLSTTPSPTPTAQPTQQPTSSSQPKPTSSPEPTQINPAPTASPSQNDSPSPTPTVPEMMPLYLLLGILALTIIGITNRKRVK